MKGRLVLAMAFGIFWECRDVSLPLFQSVSHKSSGINQPANMHPCQVFTQLVQRLSTQLIDYYWMDDESLDTMARGYMLH